MKQLILTALAAIQLLLPTVAMADVQTSPTYTINGGSSSPSYITSIATPGGAGDTGAHHTGDIDGDGKVDIVDAMLILKSSSGLVQLSAAEIMRGDVSPLGSGVPVGDGQIDIKDALLVLRKAVGLGW